MKTPAFLLGAVLASPLVPPVAPPALAAPAPTFTSKKEGYAIYLPGKPTVASRPVRLPGMGQITVNFISVARPPLSYVVIPMKLPGNAKNVNANQFLDGVQRGFTLSTAAKLLYSKKISLNSVPGREIMVQAGPNLMRGRFFVKGNRSYQVIAVSPRASDARYRAQALKVLDSFRILN